MKSVKAMMRSDSDVAMSNIQLDMTPERKQRINRAMHKILDIVMTETANPAEGIAALQLLIDAINEDCFRGRGYIGTVIIGDRATKESICWGCGTKLNLTAAANGSGEAPSKGDVTVCAHCGAILVYDADSVAIKPDKETVDAAMKLPQVIAMVAAIKAQAENKGGQNVKENQ